MSPIKVKVDSARYLKITLISFAYFAFFIVLAVSIGYFSIFTVEVPELENKIGSLGAVGDFFGGILNPSLSFFALLALLYTIYIQSKELALTREELEMTRSEIEKSAKAQSKQSDILEIQQFEQTFFSLLEQHNKALESILTPKREGVPLSAPKEKLLRTLQDDSSLVDSRKVFFQNNQYCGFYFRILFQLLKYIATNIPNSQLKAFSDKDDIAHSKLQLNEKMYSNMIRAILPDEVLQLLAINCACPSITGEELLYWKYKLLIERYEFLEHMPFEIEKQKFICLESTLEVYHEKAFGKSVYVTALSSQSPEEEYKNTTW